MGAVGVSDPVAVCAGLLHGLPGPASAAALAALAARSYQPGRSAGSAAGPLDEVVELVLAARRLEGWATWCQLSATARLLIAWTDRSPLGDAIGDGCEQVDPALAKRLEQVVAREEAVRRVSAPPADQLAAEFASAELALACGLSRTAASQRVTVAWAVFVAGRHLRVARLAHAGLVDWPKLHLLVTKLNGLDPAVADQVEKVLITDDELACAWSPVHPRQDPTHSGAGLPFVASCTVAQLRARIEQVAVAADPDGRLERDAKAREERKVTAHPEPHGMASLHAHGPAEAVIAIVNDLDAAAAAAKAAGDRRTCDQIRADELFHRLTHGAFGQPARPQQQPTPAPDRPAFAPHRPARPDAAADETFFTKHLLAPAKAGAAPQLAPPDEATEATDATEAPPPAWAPSGGAAEPGGVPPSVAAEGVRTHLNVSLTLPMATWLALSNAPGQLEGYGPVAGAIARQIAADAARAHPSTTSWRCVVTDDQHGTVLGVGRPVSTPRHDPPPRLAALVRAAEPTCVFPGCTVPVTRCQLDHRTPYPHGPTCSCNLQPLCVGHHRLKTTGLVTVRMLQPGEDPDAPPGTLEWCTRAGLVYRRAPSRPLPPALEPALATLPRDLAERRREAGAELRYLNNEFAAADIRAYHRRLDADRLLRHAATPVLADPTDQAEFTGHAERAVVNHVDLVNLSDRIHELRRDPQRDQPWQPDDADDTIERPPAAIDDNPTPPLPQRPLELWPANAHLDMQLPWSTADQPPRDQPPRDQPARDASSHHNPRCTASELNGPPIPAAPLHRVAARRPARVSA